MRRSEHFHLAYAGCAVLLLACWSGCSPRQSIHDSGTMFRLRTIQTTLDAFEVDCGRYPTASEGLPALINNPGVPGWTGPYILIGTNTIAEVLSDEWGTPFRYVLSEGKAIATSAGSDRTFDTGDDLMTGKPK